MISRAAAGACILVLAFASPALAAKWAVRAKESSIAIVTSFDKIPINAVFQKWDADISFDPADLVHSSASVRIDTGSFDSQSEERDDAVKEADWFSVAAFPQAKFVTKSISATGDGRFEAVADLTIRGVTKEVKFPFTVAIANGVAHMDGSVTLQRLDFGVGQGEWKATNHVGASAGVAVHVVADQAH